MKFLIRQKETVKLEQRQLSTQRGQKSLIASGKAALTLPSHDFFVHGMELCLVFAQVYFIDSGGRQLEGV